MVASSLQLAFEELEQGELLHSKPGTKLTRDLFDLLGASLAADDFSPFESVLHRLADWLMHSDFNLMLSLWLLGSVNHVCARNLPEKNISESSRKCTEGFQGLIAIEIAAQENIQAEVRMHQPICETVQDSFKRRKIISCQ